MSKFLKCDMHLHFIRDSYSKEEFADVKYRRKLKPTKIN